MMGTGQRDSGATGKVPVSLQFLQFVDNDFNSHDVYRGIVG
jgi:hypothetical protein